MLVDGPPKRDTTQPAPVALVLAPTRELARQIYEEARKVCSKTGIRPVVIHGGTEARGQIRELYRGVDIIIATPGRLIDYLNKGILTMSLIRYLVLDESDRMLDMGFEPQIRQVVLEKDMPTQRETFMFSATFPKEIKALA
jgi:ATP-dependent RNA helicase DDX3X